MRCNGLVRFVFGHKFEGRFNGEPAHKYYSHDICLRCGMVVELSPVPDDDGGESEECDLRPVPPPSVELVGDFDRY